MKRVKISFAVKIIFAVVCLFNFNGGFVYAQPEDGRITIRRSITNKPPAPKRNPLKPAPTQKIITVPVYKTIEKLVKPTGLIIYTTPNADIMLEAIGGKKPDKQKYNADGEGNFTLEKLRAGKYKLSAFLDGYQSQETDIEIVPQKMLPVEIVLDKVKYNFSIQTNVDKGEVRYAPAKIIGEPNPDGTLNVQETAGYCIVPIKNKKAEIKELPEGTYNLDVRAPDTPEYKPEEFVIKIPQDIPEKEDTEPNLTEAFQINLKYTQSTDTFTSLSENDWKLPENWKTERDIMKTGGAGTALPKDNNFRFYKDFEMQAIVYLPDNSAVNFIMRAEDENNYYLIRLTGNTAKEPFTVSAVIFRNGKPTERVMPPTAAKHVIGKAVAGQKPFEIIIKAKGNTFEIFAVDETGVRRPLGNAVFKDNNYPIGAVGVAAMENSNFEIRRFIICHEFCR